MINNNYSTSHMIFAIPVGEPVLVQVIVIKSASTEITALAIVDNDVSSEIRAIDVVE